MTKRMDTAKRVTIIAGILGGLTVFSWGEPAGLRPVSELPSAGTLAAGLGRFDEDPWIRDRRKEEAILSTVSGLARSEQLALYLGGRSSSGHADRARAPLAHRVKRLLGDPAVAALFVSIEDDWFRGSLTDWTDGTPLFSTARELVGTKIMIARNLYFRGLSPTAESVREEYERIQRLRNRYAEMEVFRERNVVFAASDDLTKDGDHMFGRPPEVRWIGRKAESMVFLRKGEGTERPADTRALLAEKLSTLESLTFVFEGHGRPRQMKFIGGLSPEDVVESLVERPSRESSLLVSNPWSVLIINACQAHTFSRELLDVFRRAHPESQLPVVIVPIEFGDDLVKSVYNDGFLRSELRLSYNTNTHLGALFGRMSLATSVYVPDEDNVLTQIA